MWSIFWYACTIFYTKSQSFFAPKILEVYLRKNDLEERDLVFLRCIDMHTQPISFF